MDEQPPMLDFRQLKRAYPVEMLARQIGGIVDPVAVERLLAAVAPPIHEVAVGALHVGRAKQHLLMVAPQTDEGAVLLPFAADEKIHHLAALGSPVDIVSDKHKLRAPLAAKLLARGEQRRQLVKAAVDVADREGEFFVLGKMQSQVSPACQLRW